jgi:hypothetical protein
MSDSLLHHHRHHDIHLMHQTHRQQLQDIQRLCLLPVLMLPKLHPEFQALAYPYS